MPQVHEWIGRGYFPRELPPAFTTQTFANLVQAGPLQGDFNNQQVVTKVLRHSVANKSGLRRQLGIPNPVGYFQTARTLTDNWQAFQGDISKSPFCKTIPAPAQNGRLIPALEELKHRPKERVKLRRNGRFILFTDINRFYHSIYTHSIPWAVHTKPVAKANHGFGLRGNLLDSVVRRAQDKQTYGIPVGPDASLVVAEMILGQVDLSLFNRGIRHGIRYIDDYELSFESYSAAENGLALLQDELHKYELELNAQKTKIIELPFPSESPAISEIRSVRPTELIDDIFDEVGFSSMEVMRFFDRLFELHRATQDDSVLRFGLSRIAEFGVAPGARQIADDLLLQTVLVDGGLLHLALSFFEKRASDDDFSTEALVETLNRVIVRHAPLGHGHEVAWSIWGILLFEGNLTADAATLAIRMMDPIVSVLLLHANSENRVAGVPLAPLEALAVAEELYGEAWLFAYEAIASGWLAGHAPVDYVAANQAFGHMRANNVRFYDPNILQAKRDAIEEGVEDIEGEDYSY